MIMAVVYYGHEFTQSDHTVKGTVMNGDALQLSADAVRSLSSLFAIGRRGGREQLGEVRVSKGVAERHSVVTVVLQHSLDEVEELPVIARVRHHVSLQTHFITQTPIVEGTVTSKQIRYGTL